jgi:hypothetical protein
MAFPARSMHVEVADTEISLSHPLLDLVRYGFNFVVLTSSSFLIRVTTR